MKLCLCGLSHGTTYIHPPVTFPKEVGAGQASLTSRLFKKAVSLLPLLFILESDEAQTDGSLISHTLPFLYL